VSVPGTSPVCVSKGHPADPANFQSFSGEPGIGRGCSAIDPLNKACCWRRQLQLLQEHSRGPAVAPV
jgi:hypothetical protein